MNLHCLVMESNEVKLRFETFWQAEGNAEEGSDYEDVPGVWYYRAVQGHSTGVSDYLDMDECLETINPEHRTCRTRHSTARARKRCRTSLLRDPAQITVEAGRSGRTFTWWRRCSVAVSIQEPEVFDARGGDRPLEAL